MIEGSGASQHVTLLMPIYIQVSTGSFEYVIRTQKRACGGGEGDRARHDLPPGTRYSAHPSDVVLEGSLYVRPV